MDSYCRENLTKGQRYQVWTMRMLNLECSWQKTQGGLNCVFVWSWGPWTPGLRNPGNKGGASQVNELTGAGVKLRESQAVRFYLWGFKKQTVDHWKSFRADLILKRSLEITFFPPFIGWGGNQEPKYQPLSTNPGQSVNDSLSCINPCNCRHLIDWIY